MSLADPLDGLEIRAYREGDHESLVALWETLGLLVWYNKPERDIALWVESADAEILIGEVEGRLVASVCVGHDGHRGYFYYLATAPELQRRGLGRRMVAEAEAWLKRRKVPKVQLFVRPTNEQANGFYEALGERTQQLANGLAAVAEDADIPMAVECLGGMFGFVFTDAGPVRSFAQVANADINRFKKFFHGMLAAGIYLAPSAFEAGFVSAAHGDDEISATLEAARKVLANL